MTADPACWLTSRCLSNDPLWAPGEGFPQLLRAWAPALLRTGTWAQSARRPGPPRQEAHLNLTFLETQWAASQAWSDQLLSQEWRHTHRGSREGPRQAVHNSQEVGAVWTSTNQWRMLRVWKSTQRKGVQSRKGV